MKASFRVGWHFLCKLSELQSVDVCSMFAVNICRISRDQYRDRPVVSETPLMRRYDSPPPVGPDEKKTFK